MKQRFTKLLAAVALLVGLTIPMGMWGQTRETTILFNETFSNCTGTMGWSGTAANGTFVADNEGWTVENAYGAGGCAKFGASKKKGTAETPEISLSGNATLTFRSGAWSGDATTLNLSATGCNISATNVTLNQGSWSDYTINITNGNGSVKIKFEASATNSARFFLDDVVVSQESGTTLLDNEVTLNPTSLVLDMNVNSTNHTGTITCTTLGSGAISVSENDYVSTIVSGNTITVTPVAVTTEAQTLTVTQAADGTYAEGTAEFTVTVVNTTPTVTVTYHPGVNGVSDVVETPYQGSDYPVADNPFSYEGHAFTGWKDGNNNEYAPGDVIQAIANNYDMYAQWVEAHEVGDVLNREFIGVTSTSYTGWSGKTGTSGAVYAGQSAGGSNDSGPCIQLRTTNSNSGIVTTATGGTVTKVVVVWDDYTANDRTLDIYGKNTAYEAATDLYDEEKQGTLLGGIVCGSNSTELIINGNYAFIGMRSRSGAIYITEIEITWSTSSTPDPSVNADDVVIAYDDEEGEIEFEILYGVDGGTVSAEVIGTPTIVNFDLGDETTSPISFTCDANNSNTDRTATVRLTYTYIIDNTTETKTKEVTITQTGNPDFVNNISDIISSGTNYRVKGTVVAKSNNGFVIGDNTGYVYTYKSTSLSVGDKVILVGTTGNYNHVIQFTNNVEITTTESSNYNGTPAVTVISEVPDYTEGLYLSTYFQYEGVLSTIQVQSGNNTRTLYLVAVGQSHICISYPSEAQIAAMDALLGKTVRVKGYFSGYNSNDYFTTLMESVEEVSSETVELPITGYTNGGGWNLIASPVVSIDPASAGMITDDYVSSNVTPDNGTYDLYHFNQSAELEWENYRVRSFALESGKGYLYASKEGVTVQFTGAPYNSNGEIPLVYDAGKDFAGWNLIGNPFGVAATLDMPYYRMNDNQTTLGAKIEDDQIAAMEGVFVYAYDADEQQAITKATFTRAGRSNNASQGFVNLNVEQNASVVDNVIVRFDEGRSLPKLQLFKGSAKLFITKNGKDYAIVNSEAQGEMPVNFKAQENGTYTLNIDTENVEMNYLHLIDNMTGMDVDLLQTPSYTFDATTNDYTSRFRLVFSANDVNEQNAETFAFFSNGNWVVNNEGEATLQVIDVNGRIVSNETINGTVATSINATPGVYMLRLVNGNEVKTQKIVVK